MAAKILRHPASIARGFESSGLHPALSSWIASGVPADNDIRKALREVRARSRDAAQNDDHQKYFLRLVEANVIGRSGVTVQAKPKLANGRQDRSAATAIEAAYENQCERGNWDVSGQLSRSGFSRLGVRTVAQDGEVLIRIHEYGPDAPTGFAVELIDAEALDIDYNQKLANGNFVRMGVEMTPRRRPIAYWLFSEADSPHGGYRQAPRIRVPAEEVFHVYLPEWVWGSRGVPWAVTALRRMKMLSGYEEAAITAARAAAVKSAVYKQEEWSRENVPPAGSAVDGEIIQDLSPGQAEILPYGYDLKTIDWAWPNTDHGEFVTEAMRGIACGMGVAHSTVSNNLENVNYSSLRQGAITERDLWMMVQDWWIDWVERPLYRRWLSFALRNGTVTRRNGELYDQSRLSSLWKATFQARRWPWIDPLKDMQANREAVKLRVRSLSDIIRESGRDPEEVWSELESDIDRLESMGLSLDEILGQEPQQKPEQSQEQDTEEQDDG